MYHISLCVNRDSILKNGLNSSGVSPWPDDNYPSGTYFFDNISKARNYGFGNGDPFDVYQIDTSSYKVENDPITQGAFFIKETILTKDIELIEKHENDVANPMNENERQVISYDFDGCMHVSVVGHDPINFTDADSWEPFTEMHDQLREDAKNHKIIIVTARPPETNVYVQEFLDKYKLPVEEIYATNNWPKTPLLLELGAIKHYDDNDALINPLKAAGIEFILVDPFKRTQVVESVETMEKLQNFLITFTNHKFYVSDNTIKAFIDRVKQLDPGLIHDPRGDGKGKDYRGIMIRSSLLTQPDIKGLFQEFTKKYDWLKMDVVVTKYA